MRFLFSLVKNPFTLWVYWMIQKNYLECIYWKKKVHLGYLTNIRSSKFGGNNKLYDYVRLWYSSIGEFTYIAKNTEISRTTIGKFCSIGPNVKIGLGTHPSSQYVSSHPAFYSTVKQAPTTFVSKNSFQEHAEISIGNDVWVGANVIIQDGIKISDGAIIGAGAVVTKDVGPYEIVGGVPAKLIRKRFTEEQIDFLLGLKWWDRGLEWQKANTTLMADIELLMKQNKKQ